MNKVLIILLAAFPAFALGGTSLVGQYGNLRLNQEAAEKLHVTPSGPSYGVGFTNRKDFLEFEAMYIKAKSEAKIKHDNSTNYLVHEQSSILLNLNFYVFKHLYVRGGIGLHKIEQSLKKPMSDASTEGAKKAYGIHDKEFIQGLLLGAGVVILDTSVVQIFGQLDKMTYPSMDSGAWNASLGFRIYID